MDRIRRQWDRIVLGVALLPSLLAPASSVAIMRNRPAPSPAGEASLYERAVEDARSGSCATALPLLEQARAAEPHDADVWSLLGYCQRKSGQLDEAFVSYRRALDLRPEFPAAREYLGEAHLQAAMREIEILRGYGDDAREELSTLVDALRKAADTATRRQKPTQGERGHW